MARAASSIFQCLRVDITILLSFTLCNFCEQFLVPYAPSNEALSITACPPTDDNAHGKGDTVFDHPLRQPSPLWAFWQVAEL